MTALKSDGCDVVGTRHNATIDTSDFSGLGTIVPLDVRYYQPFGRLIRDFRPDWIFHLAAQSYPTVSWLSPHETFEVNVTGTLNLFEAIKEIRRDKSEWNPSVVVACSSAEYGASLAATTEPIHEDAALLPLHPYGVSKVAQDLLAYQYHCNDGIRALRARIFNTTGPRKKGDVVSDFAARAATIMRDAGASRFPVGNLSTRRAILDVRDLVAALIALQRRGVSGESYNICATQAFTIREILTVLETIAGVTFDTVVDPALLRPSDEPVIFGSTAKIRRDTGWAPRYSLEETVRSVFEHARLRAR
jgi:nucleoside-diphosphate-sugar epimerase